MGIKQIIIGVFKLFFSKESFAKYATEEGAKEVWNNNEDLQKQFPEGIPEENFNENYGYNLNRANALRNSLFTSAVITAFSIVSGSLSGYILSCYFPPVVKVINFLQIVGAGILLCASISVLSHEIESYGKQTLAEKINRAIFKTLYVIGSFLLFLAMSWNT